MKSKDTFNTLNIVTTAMLCAVGIILATILHQLTGRYIAVLLSPMHFPVLLTGILCGPWLGLIGGVITPIVSSLAGGTLTADYVDRFVPMIFELGMYGFLTGMMRKVFIKNPKTNKFASILALVIAMVTGRFINAVVKTIIIAAMGHTTFVAMLKSFGENFSSTWAGIIVQLVLIPMVLFALQKGGILLKYLPDTPTAAKQVASAEATDSEQTTAATDDVKSEKNN